MSTMPLSAAPRAPGLITALIGLMFFVFGFVTWLNGPLIVFVKLAFALDDVTAFMVPMVFYMSYFVFALPGAAILRRTGMKKGMTLGLLVMAAGAVLFGQAATMRIFPVTLAGLFVIGSGLTILQTAANPYISIAGPIESAARRIAVMGICNKVAGILAPIVIGGLVLSGVTQLEQRVDAAPDDATREALLDAFAAGIHTPYLVMAGLLAALALFILRSPLPEIRPAAGVTEPRARRGLHVLKACPHLRYGVLCLFLYVGVEVMAGDAIGIYGQAFGLPTGETAFFTSFTLAAMLAGYLLGLALIPRVVSQERYLAVSAILGIVLVIAASLTRDYLSVGFVAALGLANAMMWPAIFPLAIRNLGRDTETGSAMMIMAICGGAIVPQLFAILKQHLPFQFVFLILMAPAYGYILFYARLAVRAGIGKAGHA